MVVTEQQVSHFHREMLRLIVTSVNNFYPDNFDGEIRKQDWLQKGILLFEKSIRWFARLAGRNVSNLIFLLMPRNYYWQHLDEFQHTYDMLSDDVSRAKYVELLGFKMLGASKVRLSLNTPDFPERRAAVDTYLLPEKIPVNFRQGYLQLYDLKGAGHDLKLYFVRNGIYLDFFLQQYNYEDIVSVIPGDVVIDAGACWGDTALYFASRGASRVFSFEFIPSNLQIFNRNMALNPHCAERITCMEHALWESSGMEMSFEDGGPSSRVAAAGVYADSVTTLSIDEMVRQQQLKSLDFIKMDIEGAEMPALKGAAESIRRFKPKLAISVYHKPDDFLTIPAYLQKLNPDYQFYLDYYTIFGDEIVLYAINRSRSGLQ